MKKLVKKRKKPKDWFRIKKYPHIGMPFNGKSRIWVQAYVQDKTKIAAHGFLPFIHKLSKVRRFRKEICHDGTRSKLRKPSTKERELYYSSHLDSNIYSYYAELIAKLYETKLQEFDIQDCVTAYRRIPVNTLNPRSRNKCNVDFANEIFAYIKNSNIDYLIAITFDIKSFFDSLNHSHLKKMWREVIGSGSDLPADHYNIFRNITKFSFVEERDIFREFKDSIRVEREPSLIKSKKVAKRRYLRAKRAIAFCFQDGISKLKAKNYIKSNKFEIDEFGRCILRSKGIPQGSPISSVLANVYMLEFDRRVKEFLGNTGIYRRYSDDMVVICDLDGEKKVIDFIKDEISKVRLELQDAKTQIFLFINDKKTNQFYCREKNIRTGKTQTNTKFEYLGFQFDGFYTLLKPSSLASYYRKMKRSIKRGFFYSHHNRTKTKGELFKNRLYKRFTHLGAHRRRIYQRDKNNASRFVLTHKFDWGNYLSYAFLAANIISDNKIRRQVRKHWKKFHDLINDD